MKITLGFSPCPNDTFIFDAMVNGKIDTEGLEFEPVMEDVEALNDLARQGRIDCTKLSYHAFAHLAHLYRLLDAGSALGNNCGPLLVAKSQITSADLATARIAIPGQLTTANFLLGIAYPNAQNKTAMLFSAIEDAVVDGRFDAGLIIHENRFTYQEKGLVQIADLGAYWEQTTGYPIPLGGIVVNRNLDPALQQKLNRVMRRSVAYAFDNPANTMPFVRCYAQAMSDDVMRAHIKLYVTDFTLSLGEKGRAAIHHMLEKALDLNLISSYPQDFFVE